MLFGNRSRVSGFSLIEVIASLMLVGTLLVMMLQAHRDSAKQIVTANKRLAAVSLLSELLSAPDQFVLQEPAGKVPGENSLHWRTLPRADRQAETLRAMIVRVELFDPKFREGATLASVELLAPGTNFVR